MDHELRDDDHRRARGCGPAAGSSRSSPARRPGSVWRRHARSRRPAPTWCSRVANAARIETAVSTVRDQVPDAELEAGSLDLASLDSVRAFAQWYSETHDRLHLLINNAGVMYTPLERTAEGFEMQFGTNHVGHFLLTNLLVPMLLADPPSRIVNLSSGGHRGSDIVWDDPNYERREYDKFSAYGQSKTANILFSVELERRLADRGVHAYAVHPGMIATELGRHMTEDDFAQMVERAKRGTVGRAAAAQDGRAGRGHVGLGRHRPRARRAGRHLPRRHRGHRRATPPGPATPSPPSASGPSPRTSSASASTSPEEEVAGLKQVL